MCRLERPTESRRAVLDSLALVARLMLSARSYINISAGIIWEPAERCSENDTENGYKSGARIQLQVHMLLCEQSRFRWVIRINLYYTITLWDSQTWLVNCRSVIVSIVTSHSQGLVQQITRLRTKNCWDVYVAFTEGKESPSETVTLTFLTFSGQKSLRFLSGHHNLVKDYTLSSR